MSLTDELRVLNRIGARQLTDAECELITGALIIRTKPCTIQGVCGNFDGDCEPPPC